MNPARLSSQALLTLQIVEFKPRPDIWGDELATPFLTRAASIPSVVESCTLLRNTLRVSSCQKLYASNVLASQSTHAF